MKPRLARAAASRRREADLGSIACKITFAQSQRFADRFGHLLRATAGLDLAEGDLGQALRAQGFDAAKPTLWVLEGLTYYLAEHENAGLFKRLAALSAAGSVLVASMAPEATATRPGRTGLVATWKWGFAPDFPEVRRALKHANESLASDATRGPFVLQIARCQHVVQCPGGGMQTAQSWGWSVADAIDYPTVAQLYGYNYSGRSGVATVASEAVKGAGDGAVAAPAKNAFATDRVLLVACTRAQGAAAGA